MAQPRSETVFNNLRITFIICGNHYLKKIMYQHLKLFFSYVIVKKYETLNCHMYCMLQKQFEVKNETVEPNLT